MMTAIYIMLAHQCTKNFHLVSVPVRQALVVSQVRHMNHLMPGGLARLHACTGVILVISVVCCCVHNIVTLASKLSQV